MESTASARTVVFSVLGDSGRDQQPISASQLSAEQIRKVQQKLNQEGFHAGQVDGKWSSETQTAIRNFQNTKGMKATGQLDERTLDQLGLDADEFRQKSESGSGKAQPGSGSSSTRSGSGSSGTNP